MLLNSQNKRYLIQWPHILPLTAVGNIYNLGNKL